MLVRTALDLGINFFDTGPTYGDGCAEVILGNALHGIPREDYVLTSKVYFPTSAAVNSRGLSRKNIIQSVDRSLERLRVDYLDIYMMHRWDPTTPIEETLDALNDVVRAGKSLYLGASSMLAWQFMKCLGIQRSRGLAPFICMQNYYNLIYREEEREMLPLCNEEGIGVLPWSPLARGMLAGSAADARRLSRDPLVSKRYIPGLDDETLTALGEVSTGRGVMPAVVALAWLLAKPTVSAPVVGCSSVEELTLNIQALEFELTAAELMRFDVAYKPHPVLGM